MKKKAIPCHKAGRITSFFLLISIFLLIPSITTPVHAAKTYAQQTVFTLHAADKTVKEVLEYVEKNSEFVVLYSKDLLPILQKKVSVSIDKQNVESILNILSKEVGLKYTINDRQITITKAPTETPQQEKKTKITGQVLDENGEGVPGANVTIKGNNSLGAVTNIEGNFTLMAPENSTLIASFIGYTPVEIQLKGKKIVVFKLTPDAQALEEVVVVGFGTQKKASVVGAVQSIKPAELRVPSSNLSTSFAGRIAGVISMQRTGEPGSDGANFWIRGAATFSGTTDPLIFIDGVEVSAGDMNAIPSEAIENFSILKDASATALYGARGANGVILITTRSGKDLERARINVRIDNTFTAPTRTLKLADAVTAMQLRNEAILTRNPDGTPAFSADKIQGTLENRNQYVYPNVDWFDYMFKDYSMNQSANLNVMGGTKKVDYFISASINNDNGMLKKDPNNTFDNNIQNLRYSFQSNVGAWLTSSTKVNVRINSQIVNYNGPSTSMDDLYKYVMEAPSMYFAPVYPNINNEDHTIFGNKSGGPIGAGGFSIYRNPYASMVQGSSKQSAYSINTAFELEQKLDFITKGLNFKALVSFKNWSKTTVNRSFSPYFYELQNPQQQEDGSYIYDYNSISKGRTALETSTSTTGDRLMNLQATLNYQHTFDDKHDVGAMLVYLQREYNLNNPDNNYYNTLPKRNQGLAGRLTYAYDGRYLAEFNFGYNGSENFEKGSRYGFFPSLAVGYLISNEQFFEPLTKVISNLKIRASYGLVGNADIGSNRFPYLTKVDLSGAGFVFGDQWQTSSNGATITTYGAEKVTWEIGKKYNVGFDLGLFNKLSLNVDFFREDRKDIFLRRNTIPAESGITGDLRPYGNLGKVRNQGVDMSLDYNHAVNKDFMISAKGTFTYAKNQYVEIDEPDYEFSYMSQVGRPLNQYKGYIALGLFKDQEEIDNSPKQILTGVVQPGDIKYADLNNDGKIDGNDQTYIGNPELPQISYGLGVSIQYKKWDASIFFQGVGKRSIMLSDIHPFGGESYGVMQFVADNRWTEANPNSEAMYPRLTNGKNNNNNPNSTYWLRDGSYIRLKNVELGYSYKFLRAYISGQNLLTFSKFKLWDPELYTSNGLKYPTQIMGSIGLQFTF
ncbi:TonB-dependent receptor [Bacteroides fragilis]|uniref:SusC/RagA family TonB-linked outer membrane protein n=1 Tax=Bacteroides fragilis TaxID=817 RepID=UPI000C773486|nr:SusC/RagA family TonB-linked outer membrane protein [Bacteroides fragilis]AUI48713.1 SusC/RagA family TonB-linked outer membrane protein [Bacteroides fragilis]MCE8558441.1 TonB-dependent receptor [Bacteroides fragilis]